MAALQEWYGEDVSLAWAAGFLEGEGCFGWYWHRPDQRNGALVVTAVQKDREPLDRLRAIFGTGLITQRVDRGRESWEWRVNGHAAVPVMTAVLPFMSARRQQRITWALEEHEAVQARVAAKRRACPRGHLRAEHGGRRANGHSYCRECSRERSAARRASNA